jgi:hypothetical protein
MKQAAVLFIILLISAIPLFSAEAARGAPGSQQFGFGGCVYLDGQYRREALYIAQNLGLDWVQIDVSWREIWPDPSQPANWVQLDETLIAFKDKSIAVMLSITDAPGWVMSPNGPDANLANAFLGQLLTRYPDRVQALELFPSANTQQGWGTQPDPGAYLNLFVTVRDSLQQSYPSVVWIAGGLIPAQTNSQIGEMSDLEFLQGLYNAGARNQISVISLNFSNLTNDPSAQPSSDEPRLLRHYEEIRQVMVNNQHANGILWINHLLLPVTYSGSAASEWITQAYSQLRSQLYMGVVFYDSLNPPNPQKHPANPNALLLTEGQYHPAYEILRAMIKQNSNGSLADLPGRPKSDPLIKGGK